MASLLGRTCTIYNLSPATNYTVQAAACLNEASGHSLCSTFTRGGQNWTEPTGKNLPGLFYRVYELSLVFIQCFTVPMPPNFRNRSTLRSVEAFFAKVPEDVNQLIYRMRVKDTTGVSRTGDCSVYSQVCNMTGLTPGRKYLLSVQACISEDPGICGTFSDDTTSYTIPESELHRWKWLKLSNLPLINHVGG